VGTLEFLLKYRSPASLKRWQDTVVEEVVVEVEEVEVSEEVEVGAVEASDLVPMLWVVAPVAEATLADGNLILY
jgi:hypothetical protein